jgi:hypothetical protein
MNLTEIAKKIDRNEKERVDELWKELESGKERFNAAEVFGSHIIAKMLDEKPLCYYESFDLTNCKLPLSCLLYSRAVVEVCPLCDCNSNPSLIKPYLERGLILPVLLSKLKKYTPEFTDLVIQYPYVGEYAFNFMTYINPYTAAVMCEHCYNERWQHIIAKIADYPLPEKRRKSLCMFLQKVAKPAMSDPTERESIVLEQMKEAADRRELKPLLFLTQKGMLLSKLRNASLFEAVPQVDQEYLRNVGTISQELELQLIPQAVNDQEKELIIKGLNLDFNPKMPLEEYLDIILPRRKKINALINDLIKTSDREEHISRINDELWEINRDVVSSKSLESLSFLTNLVTDNLNIVSSLLVGATLGYSSGQLLGCGIGSVIGMIAGTGGKKLSHYAGANIPRIPRKTIEWTKTLLESPQEKMLSLLLSKDVKTIQVWLLRKRMGKT